MSFPRFNIGARYDCISTSLNTLYRSFSNSLATITNGKIVYIVSGSSSGSSNARSSTSVACKTASVCNGTSIVAAVTRYSVKTTGVSNGASIVSSPDTWTKSCVIGTSTCTGETKVAYKSVGVVSGSSIAFARPKISYDEIPINEIVIAASNSSYEDKTYADYICDGIKDQLTIRGAMHKRTNRYSVPDPVTGIIPPMQGKITLRFTRGVFNCDDSFTVKDFDMQGVGSNVTIFEFKRPNTSPTAMYQSVMEMRIKTTDTVTLDSFTVGAGGVLKLVYDDPTIFDPLRENRFNVNNVFATNYDTHGTKYYTNSPGKITVQVAYPVNVVEPRSIPEVYLSMKNCKISDSDYSGFLVYGERNNDRLARSFKDVYFENCHAERCGVRDDGLVVAGFNLLTNISVENIRMQNCSSHDNWHTGFYFDDASDRIFSANGPSINRKFIGSNIVYNLFMENCKAYSNGVRSLNYTSTKMLPYCCGFILREMSDGSDDISSIPQFVTIDSDGIITVSAPTYPTYLRTARGPYQSRTTDIVAYGNIVNCYATNNRYAGFMSKGYRNNRAELNVLNCYASGSQYGLIVDNHNGLYIKGFVSDMINSPTVILKNVDTITVDHMKVIADGMAQVISFVNSEGYDNLMLEASKHFEVID